MLTLVHKSASLFLIILQDEKLERIIKYKFSLINYIIIDFVCLVIFASIYDFKILYCLSLIQPQLYI